MVRVSGVGRGHLKISALSCSYGSALAVDNVSLDVAAGTHVAITGANGSGKSTLLRAIGGLHSAPRGTIEMDGDKVGPAEARKRCAWVPQRQNPGRFPLLVNELLDSSSDPQAARSAAVVLELAELSRRPLSTLSGGQLQRAFLARALGSISGGATLLIADEPTAALDFAGQQSVAELLGSLTCTVIVATHDRAVAESCDRHLEMAAGELRELQ